MKRLTPAQREILLLTAEEAAELAAECARQVLADRLDKGRMAKAWADMELQRKLCLYGEGRVFIFGNWLDECKARTAYLRKTLKHAKVTP